MRKRNWGRWCAQPVELRAVEREAPRVEAELDGKVLHVALGMRVLPQGACTSPAITNLLCRTLDARLQGAATSLGFAYTRYADDLTFSTDGRQVGKLLRFVRKIVSDEGFEVHEAKTRIMRQGRAQEVTGVTVNERLGLSRKERRRLRAILHNAKKTGLDAQNRSEHPRFREHVRGKLAWVQMLDSDQARPLLDAFEELDE